MGLESTATVVGALVFGISAVNPASSALQQPAALEPSPPAVANLLISPPLEPFFWSRLLAQTSRAQDRTQDRTQTGNPCTGSQVLSAVSCAGDGWEPEEARLSELINEYRAEHDLPPIPQSASLTLLANRHVLDMFYNIGSLTHSWSNCSYDPNDRQTFYCSAYAPQWIGTAYPGQAYENAHLNLSGATARSAIRGWQTSPAHNALILNQYNWQDNRWRAMGVGIYRQYAVLWLGEDRDPETDAVATIDPDKASAPANYAGRSASRSVRRFRFPSIRIRI